MTEPIDQPSPPPAEPVLEATPPAAVYFAPASPPPVEYPGPAAEGATEAAAPAYPVSHFGAPIEGASAVDAAGAPVVPVTPAQSDPLRGILAGIGAAVIGAAVWVGIGYVTGFSFGLAATFLGVFVGFAVHTVGGKATTGMAIGAAVISVVAVVIGYLLLDIALFAKDEGASFTAAFSFIGSELGWPEAIKDSLSSAMRWLFLGLAGFAAFRIVAQQARR